MSHLPTIDHLKLFKFKKHNNLVSKVAGQNPASRYYKKLFQYN